MGLFDKKFCDVCGEKIGLLGNRKLEDGNLCKNCAKKLSPFFSERRQSTVEEIKQQLAYREENERQLAGFSSTRVLGNDEKIYLDEINGRFIVTSYSNWIEHNPDIINLSQVMSVNVDIEEDRDEIRYKDNEGNYRSYNPPRYKYEYTFNVEINVDSPYFNVISFELTEFGRRPESRFTDEYRSYERQADEIKRSLMPSMYGNQTYAQPNIFGAQQMPYQGQQCYPQQKNYNQPIQQGYPQQNGYQQPMQGMNNPNPVMGAVWVCQNCNAQNTGKFCVSCGSPQQQPMVNQYGNNAYSTQVVRCDKCGWMPFDSNNIPRFCPQCGDKFDFNDIH